MAVDVSDAKTQTISSEPQENSHLWKALETGAAYEKDEFGTKHLTTWIVTVEIEENSQTFTNPLTGKCPFSEQCSDSTGKYHSFLTSGYSEEEVRSLWTKYHITRIEKA